MDFQSHSGWSEGCKSVAVAGGGGGGGVGGLLRGVGIEEVVLVFVVVVRFGGAMGVRCRRFVVVAVVELWKGEQVW